jgi:hypothetical protein
MVQVKLQSKSNMKRMQINLLFSQIGQRHRNILQRDQTVITAIKHLGWQVRELDMEFPQNKSGKFLMAIIQIIIEVGSMDWMNKLRDL